MENLFLPLLIVSKDHGICIRRASNSHFVLFLKSVNSLSLPHFEISFAIVFCYLFCITLYMATFFLMVKISSPHLFIFCAKDLNHLYVTYVSACHTYIMLYTKCFCYCQFGLQKCLFTTRYFNSGKNVNDALILF
jgi:hypothetical protein